MLIAVSYASLLGGYSDRPELLEDENIQSLTNYVVEYLATTQDLILNNYRITRVQTQIVAGINYKIDFTAESIQGGNEKILTCQAIIYVRFDSTKKITKAQCDTA
jgi:hypothetical protein